MRTEFDWPLMAHDDLRTHRLGIIIIFRFFFFFVCRALVLTYHIYKGEQLTHVISVRPPIVISANEIARNLAISCDSDVNKYTIYVWMPKTFGGVSFVSEELWLVTHSWFPDNSLLISATYPEMFVLEILYKGEFECTVLPEFHYKLWRVHLIDRLILLNSMLYIGCVYWK